MRKRVTTFDLALTILAFSHYYEYDTNPPSLSAPLILQGVKSTNKTVIRDLELIKVTIHVDHWHIDEEPYFNPYH